MPATVNNSNIGFATYQQQDTSGRPASDLASIILFFSVICIILLSVVFYLWITRWHKVPAQQRREEQIEDQKEIDQLVENLKDQVKTVFRIPVLHLMTILFHNDKQRLPNNNNNNSISNNNRSSHEHLKVNAYKFYHLFSLLCLVVMLVSFIVLIGTASSSETPSSPLLQTFLFILVLCVNLYLITRQRCYYKERKELFGSDDAHMQAVYKTRFKDWDSKMWTNWVQIAILIIEFFQLLVFPLRDFITVNLLHTSSNSTTTITQEEDHGDFLNLVTIIMNAGGFMPDMRTPTWYTYSVWTVFATAMLGLLIAFTVHCINMWRPYKIPTRWVHWCIPVTTLLYIPVLTTFVSSAACQTLNVPSNEFFDTLRCHSSSISQKLYLWSSVAGYVVAYFLLTIFLTSYERKPKNNEIAFKSISVAFIKNMGLFLAIVYLLVETTSQKNRIRAILSIMILLTMICYNIKTRPCYVDKINYFRTASFCCILWTSVLVAVLSDTNAAETLGPLVVLCIIVGGWGLIILIFLLVYFTYYIQNPRYSENEYDSFTTPTTMPSVPAPAMMMMNNNTMTSATNNMLSSPYYNNNKNYIIGSPTTFHPAHNNDPRMMPLETVMEENHRQTPESQHTTNNTSSNKEEEQGVFAWATRWWSTSSSLKRY